MRSTRTGTVLISGLMLLGIGSTAQAQWTERRVSIEARGGFNVPTFDISDAVDPGPSVGLGLAVQFAPKLWLMGDVDLGFHTGADLPGGGEAPDMKVYHYVAKLGYEVLSEGQSPWSVIVNAGAGALTFDVDGPGSHTYPAINVGAKLGYRLTPRVQLLLSPQGDIAFTDDDEVGTSDAWVWPFTAGVRIGL
ncbi:MAG TPA: outer membrane beta-barrel protein [Gemmatimonadales bacterium]|nr:outer membrane beta-barrel protein [Gemmatimonadales bacterium]